MIDPEKHETQPSTPANLERVNSVIDHAQDLFDYLQTWEVHTTGEKRNSSHEIFVITAKDGISRIMTQQEILDHTEPGNLVQWFNIGHGSLNPDDSSTDITISRPVRIRGEHLDKTSSNTHSSPYGTGPKFTLTTELLRASVGAKYDANTDEISVYVVGDESGDISNRFSQKHLAYMPEENILFLEESMKLLTTALQIDGIDDVQVHRGVVGATAAQVITIAYPDSALAYVPEIHSSRQN